MVAGRDEGVVFTINFIAWAKMIFDSSNGSQQRFEHGNDEKLRRYFLAGMTDPYSHLA